MAEKIILYSLDEANGVAVDRKEVQNNRWTTYKDKYIHVIDVFLFNEFGELLLQKRAKSKKTMPGRLHTTI